MNVFYKNFNTLFNIVTTIANKNRLNKIKRYNETIYFSLGKYRKTLCLNNRRHIAIAGVNSA